MYVQYLSDMQTLFDSCNVHAQGIPCTLLYTSGTQRVKESSILKDELSSAWFGLIFKCEQIIDPFRRVSNINDINGM